jgi:hypothetical protein
LSSVATAIEPADKSSVADAEPSAEQPPVAAPDIAAVVTTG